MSRIDLAWAAGFYDGEGSTGTYSTDGYASCRITIVQKTVNEVVLHKFNAVTGNLGHVYRNRYGMSMLNINTFERVQAVLAMLWLDLGTTKREQFIRALATVRANPHRRYTTRRHSTRRKRHVS